MALGCERVVIVNLVHFGEPVTGRLLVSTSLLSAAPTAPQELREQEGARPAGARSAGAGPEEQGPCVRGPPVRSAGAGEEARHP